MRTSAIRFQPDDRNFEAIFEIADSHRLVQVRSKTRGGIMSANYWRHDEYGSDGKLAARTNTTKSGQLLHVSESLAER